MATILLVEDNDANRDMLSRRLIRRGFDVTMAVDGRSGFDAACLRVPDLVIMDMNLPDIDGWETTRMLKAEPRTAHVPVIALTAHAMISDRQRAFEAGCDDYDTKPVDMARLVGKIDALLAGARQS
jgi:CheY-like chemotaxis protein